jgi:ATP-binding cassette subfamily B protein
MQVGDLTAFITYMMLILMSIMMASMMFVMIPRAQASAVRVNEILDTVPTIVDPEKQQNQNSSKRGYVEFKNVGFSYPGAQERVLSNISFSVNPGETTAIIGSTGSGKSTIISLIPRLYDVTEGSILVDGVDIRQINQETLRQKIGYIPQKAFLFSGSIEDNLRYGKEDATEQEMWHALEVAQGKDFVSAMEEGIKSHISQGATNVSGGQKQRIAIARALIKKPEIYIFDDSFSALDLKTDAKLRQALKPETADATVLIVAQRVSSIMHADRIIVIDEGKIVGIGTHNELVETCEVYSEIVASQLTKEEM